jgi:hypothetical protein
MARVGSARQTTSTCSRQQRQSKQFRDATSAATLFATRREW